MGLLDNLFDPQDPRSAGALNAAFALLGQQGYGNAGMAGLGAAMNFRREQDQRKRASLQDQLLQGQIGAQTEAAARQKRQDDWLAGLQSPQMQASQAALSGGGGPTVANAQRMPAVDPTQQMLFDGVKAGAVPFSSYLQSLQKQDQPLQEIDPTKTYGTWKGGTFTPVVQGKPKDDTPEQIRMLQTIYGDGTPAYQAALQRLGQKQTTHAPPTQVSYGQPMAGVDAEGNPVFFRVTKDGGAPAVVPGVRPNVKPEKELTDAQAKANLFGTRAAESDKILAGLAARGTVSPSFAQQITNPSGITGRIATATATPQQQQVDQAQRDFINAILRRESGAVIADTEFANARLQYFPQPGDSREVIGQKARNRKIAIEGIMAEVPQARRGGPTANDKSKPEAVVQPSAGMPSMDDIDAELERRRRAKGGK